MKNIIKIFSLVIAAISISGVVALTPVYDTVNAQVSEGLKKVNTTPPGKKGVDKKTVENLPKNVVNWLLYAVGIISVVMLIWGGIKYIVSGGEADKIKSAKNTILYSVIGLVVAIFAYGIVEFVTNIIK